MCTRALSDAYEKPLNALTCGGVEETFASVLISTSRPIDDGRITVEEFRALCGEPLRSR